MGQKGLKLAQIRIKTCGLRSSNSSLAKTTDAKQSKLDSAQIKFLQVAHDTSKAFGQNQSSDAGSSTKGARPNHQIGDACIVL